MNKYLKEFLHCGLLFAGFGPIVLAIIYFILSCTVEDFLLEGKQVFVAVISIYLLAFVHAGSNVFNKIEHWSIMKGLLCQLAVLYFAYVICYLINSWIPFKLGVVAMFTIIFVAVYFTIWGIVYLCVSGNVKKLNEKLE